MEPRAPPLALATFLAFATHFLVPIAQACSNSTYDDAYDGFPDCAKACLACPDSDYLRNFANNCDYAEGNCCKSDMHVVIAETWRCVAAEGHCDATAAQEAFDMFADDCDDKKLALDEGDVPDGYTMKTGGNDKNKHGPFTTAELAGLIVGVVGGILAIITAIIAIMQYRKHHRPSPPDRLPPVEVARDGRIEFHGDVHLHVYQPRQGMVGRLLGGRAEPWRVSSAELPLIAQAPPNRNALPAAGRVQEL